MILVLLVLTIAATLLLVPTVLVGLLCWWDNRLDRRFRAESPHIAAWEAEVRRRPGLLELVDEPYDPLADARFRQRLHDEAYGRPR